MNQEKRRWFPVIEKVKRFNQETGIPSEYFRCGVYSKPDGGISNQIANIYGFGSDEASDTCLIAAAPEMYELVEILLGVTVNAVAAEDFSEIRERCWSVLAKARGES